ncbi:MAG TPA: PAS domain-containing protein [Candidatus Acidoferrum sp.]|nr:PAS domain-containing protein [Candidatus Acidoferrum sp.]
MTQSEPRLPSGLEQRLRFETLLADLSSHFINLPAGQVDDQIEDAQRRVCECLGIDAASLWQWMGEGQRFLRLTHVYRPLGGPPVPERAEGRDLFPWSAQQLLAGKVVALGTVEDAPPEATHDLETWRHYGVKTTLNLPLAAGGGPPIGALSFNDMKRERAWPEALVRRLQLVGQVFANALARKQAEHALQENEARLSLAADSASTGLWSLNIGSGDFWLTNKTRQLLNLPPDKPLTFDSFLALIHAEDREAIQQTVKVMLNSGQETIAEYRVRRAEGGLRWLVARGRVQRNAAGEPDRLMGAVLDITARKETEVTLRNLSARLIQAQEEERARLAKELHDGVSQDLALLAVELDLLGQRPPEAAAQLKPRLQEFSLRTKSLLDEVHRLSRGLHPAKLEQLGLAAAMGAFCRELEAGGVIAVHFQARDVPRALPNDVALCLYRVAQEALWNVVKHSGARNATVALAAEAGAITLSVADQGKGFDARLAPPARSLGLISMRERIRLVHGEIGWESQSGQGSTVRVRVPLPAA